MRQSTILMLFFIYGVALFMPYRALAETVAHFKYNSNKIYKVYCRPGFLTDIQVKSGIEAFVLGDTVRWISAKVGTNIFVKPAENHIATSATLITQNRTYQFMLVASKSKYYQLVKFALPANMVLFKAKRETTKVARTGNIKNKRLLAQVLNKMNFNFISSGNKSLKPVQVFAYNGFTYLQMPKKLQSEPVFFIVRNGRLELVNYVVRGKYIIVERLFNKGVLKLGKKEAFIYIKTGNSNYKW